MYSRVNKLWRYCHRLDIRFINVLTYLDSTAVSFKTKSKDQQGCGRDNSSWRGSATPTVRKHRLTRGQKGLSSMNRCIMSRVHSGWSAGASWPAFLMITCKIVVWHVTPMSTASGRGEISSHVRRWVSEPLLTHRNYFTFASR